MHTYDIRMYGWYVAQLFFTTANPLKIKRHPQNQYVSIGQRAMFECFVTGSSSSFDVTWERNRRNINFSRFTVQNTTRNNGVSSSLTIRNVMIKDSGEYWCTATNADKVSFTSNRAKLISKLYLLD